MIRTIILLPYSIYDPIPHCPSRPVPVMISTVTFKRPGSFFFESILMRLNLRTLCSTLTIVIAIQFLLACCIAVWPVHYHTRSPVFSDSYCKLYTTPSCVVRVVGLTLKHHLLASECCGLGSLEHPEGAIG